jgi:hypothetical protein
MQSITDLNVFNNADKLLGDLLKPLIFFSLWLEQL